MNDYIYEDDRMDKIQEAKWADRQDRITEVINNLRPAVREQFMREFLESKDMLADYEEWLRAEIELDD